LRSLGTHCAPIRIGNPESLKHSPPQGRKVSATRANPNYQNGTTNAYFLDQPLTVTGYQVKISEVVAAALGNGQVERLGQKVGRRVSRERDAHRRGTIGRRGLNSHLSKQRLRSAIRVDFGPTKLYLDRRNFSLRRIGQLADGNQVRPKLDGGTGYEVPTQRRLLGGRAYSTQHLPDVDIHCSTMTALSGTVIDQLAHDRHLLWRYAQIMIKRAMPLDSEGIAIP
jgi:hypothetical protein